MEGGEQSMVMDTTEIQKILPHRYPFLMVDAIVELERQKRIVGVKNLSMSESVFQGHFPGKPIFPAVLILEAMAQTAAVMLLIEYADRENKLLYVVGVDEARFRRPVLPGEQLRLEMTVAWWRGTLGKVRGIATVNGEHAAEALIMCKMMDRDQVESAATPQPAIIAGSQP
jgi:3-hydroxyacyl-[acyl-carrier-protein] dehydratase